MDFDFLVDTYDTERLKTLTVWTQFRDGDLGFRLEPRARTPLEHMVHQCVSEDGFMTRMLGLQIDWPPLPTDETCRAFIAHYAEASRRRSQQLREKDAAWFLGEAMFFDVTRSRAWVLVRRIAHSAHHRGQQTTCLRLLGRDLYLTYGPSADTGGLPINGASVIYPYRSVDDLLRDRSGGSAAPHLPGPGARPPTERPARTTLAPSREHQLLTRASSVLLVDWPNPGVPRALLRAGLSVFGSSPAGYSVATLAREAPDAGDGISVFGGDDEDGAELVVFRRIQTPPARVDVVCAYRPAEELPDIIRKHVVPLGASTLWLQPPAMAEARNLLRDLNVVLVEGVDIAGVARRVGSQ